MKYFSVFSGLGGFEKAIENVCPQMGIESTCVGYSEVDPSPISVYKRHFPSHKYYGDITKINWEEVPDFHILVGGSPCQSWSVAGKRGGFEDARGTLWYEYFKCLKIKQPKYFIAENVKGILSHNNGDSFELICEAFCELGYVIDFDILNSENFGVPQKRERVYIVGIRKDVYENKTKECTRKIKEQVITESKNSDECFFFPKTYEEYTSTKKYLGMGSGSKVFSITGESSEDNEMEKSTEPSLPCLTARGAGEYHSGMQLIAKGISKSDLLVRATQLFNLNMNGRRQKGNDEPSFTLDTLGSQGVTLGDDIIRRLIPLECERAQALPSEWTRYDFEGKEVKDQKRYKMLGNAVTVTVVESLMRSLICYLT